MGFKAIATSIKNANLIKKISKHPNNYEVKQVEELDYSNGNFSDVTSITKKLDSKVEDTNSVVVKDSYVINLGFKKIDLEQELESVLANMPFEVVLTDEDKYEILNIISDNPISFLPLMKSKIELIDIIGIIKTLDKKMDISYGRLSKMVPDLNNVLKGYLEPSINGIITIDYDNIGLIWDAYLSNDSSKLKQALDKVCPNIAKEISSFIYNNYNVVIDPKEIDYTLVVSNCITDLEDVMKDLEDCQRLIKKDSIDRKFDGLVKLTELLSRLGINFGDVAHVAYDTAADTVSKETRRVIGDIPIVGGGLVKIGDTINDGYKDLVDKSASIPIFGPTINYILATDPVDKIEDIYNAGSDVASDVYNFASDVVNDIKSFFRW